MKIVTVLGARPQFIKASVVTDALRNVGLDNEVVIHTGQHFDGNMSDIFFSELGMSLPKYNLAINGGGHGAMTGRMLIEVERVLSDERPDAVLVYGDTNSTLAGALAAIKLHIPVAHVEAGLRSFNRGMPEEINRILTDQISDWLYAPTDQAIGHLLREGKESNSLVQVGDVMYDVALHHGAKINPAGRILAKTGAKPKSYILATVHRAENTDIPDRLQSILDGLLGVAAHMPIVWPIHPRTRNILERMGCLSKISGRLTLIDPVGYLDMIQLEKYAALIVTDSGGVQKEAFFYKVPCITLRNETEWTELIDSGWNQLAPPTSGKEIEAAVLSALGKSGGDIEPYGDGTAAIKIAKHLKKVLT